MATVIMTAIICVTLVILVIVPLAIAEGADKSIKELIFGPTLYKVWNSDSSHHEYVHKIVKEEDPK